MKFRVLSIFLLSAYLVKGQRFIQASIEDTSGPVPTSSSTIKPTKTQNKEYTQLSLEDNYFLGDVTLEKDEFKYFKLKIKEDLEDDEDLVIHSTLGIQSVAYIFNCIFAVIKIIPLSYTSDPDLYISKSDPYPDSPITSDWQCASYGKDTCAINSKNVTKGDTFYIGVTCSGHDCSFDVRLMLTSELLLEDGMEFQTYLYPEDARVFMRHMYEF